MLIPVVAILATAIVLIATATLAYVRWHIFTHWQRNGFTAIAPQLPWGNLAAVMRRHCSFGVNIWQLYDSTTAALCGVYLLWRPALLVRDPTLVRCMLGADFAHFHDRGVYSRPEADPISDNLFAMTGQRWRQLRAQLTPMFTSGRMKNMLPTLLEKGDNLVRALETSATADVSGSSSTGADNCVDMKDFVSRYGLDSIASVFFGMDVDTIKHRRHKFRLIEKQTNNKHYMFNLVPILIFLCPGFLQFVRLPSVPPMVKAYVMRIVTFQINQREREHIMRKDFIQILMQIRNAGRVNADESDWRVHRVAADNAKTMSIEQCAAQVFLFYVAGFDTSASVAAYTLFETARNRRVAERLQREIDETLAKYDGDLSYECIAEMRYLELCVMETVRKYPVLPLLNRICTKDYTIPNTQQTIKKGTAVVISLLGLARDPQHFPNPLDYQPERFAEQPPQYNPDAYIPFGDGPRTCIGVRLGKLMAKVVIVKLLSKYRFEAVRDAELEFENYGITLHVKGGIPMRIRNRTAIID